MVEVAGLWTSLTHHSLPSRDILSLQVSCKNLIRPLLPSRPLFCVVMHFTFTCGKPHSTLLLFLFEWLPSEEIQIIRKKMLQMRVVCVPAIFVRRPSSMAPPAPSAPCPLPSGWPWSFLAVWLSGNDFFQARYVCRRLYSVFVFLKAFSLGVEFKADSFVLLVNSVFSLAVFLRTNRLPSLSLILCPVPVFSRRF